MNEEKEKLVIKLLKYIDVDVKSLDEILSYVKHMLFVMLKN